MGLYFEGDVIGVAERAYDAGVMDNGRSFPAGVTKTVNCWHDGDVLKIKVAKSLDQGDYDALRDLCEQTQGPVRVRLELEYVFSKLQVVGIRDAANV